LESKRRPTLLVLGIAVALVLPYLLWSEQLDACFASAGFQQWLLDARAYAWLVGIGLIVCDLVLPIPVPPVMATMGAMYGPCVGGVIATFGSMLSGLCAYGASRMLGLKAARVLVGERVLVDLQKFFDTWGAAGIVASRALPVVPEAMTVLAGLSRMHFGRFMLALALGSIPVGFSLAWLGGSTGIRASVLLALTLIPACAWCAYLLIMKRRRCVCSQEQTRCEDT
jgi:uncharacterized membrane protein YdjX (TVP38/TMEM64 family)